MPYVANSAILSIGNVMPTVVRDDAGVFRKISEDIRQEYRRSLAEAVDEFTNQIARLSLVEVPKGPRGQDEEGSFGDLAASIRYPGNDPSHSARNYAEGRSDYMSATIEYDTVYAAVQHEGRAIMEHHHPIIPMRSGDFFERSDIEQPVIIEWEARHYTTPGTKDHFLSDPLKAKIPFMEHFVGEHLRAEFKLR